jgi:hypothetical protein
VPRGARADWGAYVGAGIMKDDLSKEWDFWEKRRHDAAHAEHGLGCFGMIAVFILFSIFGTPLMVISADFWTTAICQEFGRGCINHHIIDWEEATKK